MNFEISTDKESPENKKITEMLDSYNLSFAGPYHDTPLNIFVKDDTGKLLGGLLGITYWGWLYVDTLIIEESQRGTGLGTKILKAAEEEALRRGCRGVHLDTHDFQSRGFYEKQGYNLNSTIPNLPKGYNKYQMIKELGKDKNF